MKTRRVVDYTIVVDDTATGEEEVRKLLDDGWELYGPPMLIRHTDMTAAANPPQIAYIEFAQALVVYSDN